MNFLQIFREVIEDLGAFKELKHAISNGMYPCAVTGVSGIHKAQIILGMATESSPVLVIAEDEATARRLSSDINEMAGENISIFYPAKDFNFAKIDSISREYEHQRIEALSKILNKDCYILIASAEAVSQKTLPPDILIDHSITIKTSTEMDLKLLTEKLVGAGYSRCEHVITSYSIHYTKLYDNFRIRYCKSATTMTQHRIELM